MTRLHRIPRSPVQLAFAAAFQVGYLIGRVRRYLR